MVSGCFPSKQSAGSLLAAGDLVLGCCRVSVLDHSPYRTGVPFPAALVGPNLQTQQDYLLCLSFPANVPSWLLFKFISS